MTFISYAQNYEDVMLRRALRSVEHGFYVDVGAQNPITDSVTRTFYERGWSGINIEPVSQWHRLLCGDRPRDINLNIALGNTTGTLRLFAVAETGLSTADEELAQRYRDEGRTVTEVDVPVRTLTEVLDEHAPAEIHFLKIDVEGFERQVLEGLDLDRYRPWILVVEATRPNSSEERFEEWESMIVDRNYIFSYFDGLNRFYVSTEHQELIGAFRVPPNHFDDFVRRSEHEFRQLAGERGYLAHHYAEHARDLGERLSRVRGELEAVEMERVHAEQRFAEQRWLLECDANWNRNELARVQNELNVITRSLSWRVTAPLRLANRVRRALQRRFRRLVQTGATTASQANEQETSSVHEQRLGEAASFFVMIYTDLRKTLKKKDGAVS